MSLASSTLFFAIALAALEAARTVPQLARLWRTRQIAGLSASAMALRTVSGLGWLWYAVAQNQTAAVASAVVFQMVMVATAVALIRAGGMPARSWRTAIPFGGIIVATALGGDMLGAGVLPLGILMNASVLVWGIPQLLTGLRSSRLNGYSPVALTLTLVDALVWGAFGFTGGDTGYVLYFIVTMVLFLPLLTRYVMVEVLAPARSLEPVANAA